MAIYGIANGTSSGSATLTLTVGSGAGTLQAPGSGDLIYITAGNGQGNTLSSVVDSQGQSYPVSVSALTASSQTDFQCALINAKTLVLGTDTFTLTFSATGQNFAVVKGCDGIASGTADKTAGNKSGTGTTSPSSGATSVLSQPAELVVGSIQNGNTGGTPTGLSFGTGLTLNIATHGFHTEFDELVNATTAVTASGTITSNPWAATVATFEISAVSVTTNSVPGGVVGTAYSQQLAKNGGTSGFTWADVSSGAGLTGSGLSIGSGGLLHGTPTTAGTYNFTAQVTDGAGQVATKNLSVTVTGGSSLTVTTASLPSGTTGSAYTAGPFSATGGTSPYHWSISSGSLPPGLAWSGGSGSSRLTGVTIADSGVPTLEADYTWWNTNVYTAKYQKIYTQTVGSFAAPASLAAASDNVRSAVAKGIACVLCYKPTANGTTNDTTWPGGANKPAQGNASTPGTILGDLNLLIKSVQAFQNIGVTVAGICLYQEADGHKRGPTGDGLTDQWTQIPYLNYQYYPTLHSTFPTIPVIVIHVGWLQNSDSPGRSDALPFPTPLTSPRSLAVSTSTGGSFSAGPYFWRVAATDGWGRVYASNEVTLTISGTQSASLTWTNPGAGANAYLGAKANYTQIQVFRGTTAGSETTLVTTLAANATSFTDTGGAGTAQTLVPFCYADGMCVDLYGDGFDAQTTASKGRYVYSDTPLTSPGYADIADWNGLSFGWTESGNTVGGSPSITTVKNYLIGDPTATSSTASSLKNSIQNVYAARVSGSNSYLPSEPLTNFPYMWYEGAPGATNPGANIINSASDVRIPWLQAIDSTLTTGATSAGIGGTPTNAGNYTVTLQVKDSASPANTAVKAFTITVTGTTATLAITTTSLPDATVGQAYLASLTSTGGTAPVTWSQAGGWTAAGMSLDSSGAITGTPAAAGTFPLTAKVTDSAANTATATFTLTIDAVVTIPTPTPRGRPQPAVKPWRFIIANPQPDGTYLAEVSQAQTRTLTMRTGPDQYHEASVDILGTDPAAQFITELQTDIQVLLGNEILFCGRIGACADQLDASQHRFQPTALDYRQLLRRRDFAYGGGPNWTNTDVATIVNGLLKNGNAGDSQGVLGIQAYPGGNLGIVGGIGSTGLGIKQTISYGLYQMAGDVITQLAQMNPGSFDWDVTAYHASDLRVDLWAPARGVDRGVVLEYGGGLVSSIQRTTDPSTFANSVTATGATTGGNQLRNTPSQDSAAVGGFALDASDIATRAEGRWDQVVGTQITSQGALDAYTAFSLASGEVVTPSYVIQLYPGVWQGTSHIWLGDLVTVRIQSGRLNVNDQLRVAEMDFTVDPNGLETLTVTLGQIPFQLHRKIPDVLRRLRSLESE